MMKWAFRALLLTLLVCSNTPIATFAAQAMSIQPATSTVDVGSTVQLRAIGAKGKVRWTSSSTGIARVDGSGLVTGVAPGQVTITAQTPKASAAAAVTVQFIVTVPPPSSATPIAWADYYVRTDGNDSNSGTSNTAAGAWRHIDRAFDSPVTAGKTIAIAPGEYVEDVTAATSGSSGAGNTITLVADTAMGSVKTCTLNFGTNSYIRVIGLTIDPSLVGCPSGINVYPMGFYGTNTGLEFWNVNVQNDVGVYSAVVTEFPSGRCNSCIWIGGGLENVGGWNASTPLYVNGLGMTGDNNYLGYANFNKVCYLAVTGAGNHYRIMNLKFANISCPGDPGVHSDFIYPGGNNPIGYSDALHEAWWGIGSTDTTDNKGMHVEPDFQLDPGVDFNDNTWRFNVIFNLGSGYYSLHCKGAGAHYGKMLRYHFYNDTVVRMVKGLNQSDGQYNAAGAFQVENNSTVPGEGSAWVYNTIAVEGWTDAARTAGGGYNVFTMYGQQSGGATITMNVQANLLYDPRGTITAGNGNNFWGSNPQFNVDPQFVNIGSISSPVADFSLQSGSPARANGVALTNATNSGSSSTTLTVTTDTGSFFRGDNSSNLPQYSGALVPGDFIMVGSTQAQIASISGDTITLASPITWSTTDPIYYGTSTTIDIGAFPYKAGGYTLIAYKSLAAGTYTITPNDASLVRYAICYRDGVPYSIDNSSPYTCSAPASGAFSARVYPRYASPTLWAVAQ